MVDQSALSKARASVSWWLFLSPNTTLSVVPQQHTSSGCMMLSKATNMAFTTSFTLLLAPLTLAHIDLCHLLHPSPGPTHAGSQRLVPPPPLEVCTGRAAHQPGPARPGPARLGRAGPGRRNYVSNRAGPKIQWAGPSSAARYIVCFRIFLRQYLYFIFYAINQSINKPKPWPADLSHGDPSKQPQSSALEAKSPP